MAIADTRLRILAFPQRWDGTRMSVRVLVAPFGNPLNPLDPGLAPFAQANVVLSARLIAGTDRLPRPADVVRTMSFGAAAPADMAQVYAALAARFNVDPTAPAAYVAPTKTRILKLLMPSYLAATGHASPRTDLAVTDNRYVCALTDGERPAKRPAVPPKPPKWDAVLAMALRQPVLAQRLGLVRAASLTLTEASVFATGGWLYVTLDDSSDYAAAAAGNADFLKLYAARVPPLSSGVPAPVFAPVLFPVANAPLAGSFDEILHEAATYCDGFARLVHTYQPDRADYLDLSRQGERRLRPHEEAGLRIGWDDEQMVIWLNRQLTDDPRNGSPIARDTPLGVRGYRIDVREAAGPGPWTSLVRMQGSIDLGAASLGNFDGEMTIELAPSQLQGRRDGDYWLPPYFTQWTGASLIAADPVAFQASNRPMAPHVLSPVGERAVELRYGTAYDFRVRLADLTGGGPEPDQQGEPTAAVAHCRFRRFVPPDTLRLGEPVEDADGSVSMSVARPLLGYPALLYTSLSNATARLLADAPIAMAQGRLAGFADPDVTRVRIDVLVASLESDPANVPHPVPRQRLFTTFRDFDADPEVAMTLVIEFVDSVDLASFASPAAAGPIRLPTARDLDITLTPLARRDPGMAATQNDPAAADVIDPRALNEEVPGLRYFGNHAARVGTSRTLTQRRASGNEGDLFTPIAGVTLQGMFIQPDPVRDAHVDATNAAAGSADQAPSSAIQRLASQLRFEHRGQTLSPRPGRRVVFGASGVLRHVLSPDQATITFADQTQITGQWIVAVPLRLARDWTWDALTDEGLRVSRSIDGGAREQVGVVSPRRTLSATAVREGVAIDRSGTELFFFDAIDPKPAAGAFAREIDITYTVEPQFRAPAPAPAPVWSDSLRLPMAARPAQVPRIVSVGVALSPYERDAAYSKSEARRRMLWVELDEPVANPRDACFARVTMYAADPMLVREEPARPPGPLEPPLDLDPEPIRTIIPRQTPDASGLDAMQRLIPADAVDGESARHFLLPLPPQLSVGSAELFGFFVYEFRMGHADGWSTAQARFGLPQRVTGVQHPAPELACSVSRTAHHVHVSAPFATPVAGGRMQRPDPPLSQLWGLLYVQVRLADASDWRNILIGRTPLRLAEQAFRGREGSEPHGAGYFDQDEIEAWLEALGLPHNSPLSTLAVELLPEPDSPFGDPVGKDLGQVRILRTSVLTPVPAICLDAA